MQKFHESLVVCDAVQATLPSGGLLTPRGLQLLGLSGLGSSGGLERLHYLWVFFCSLISSTSEFHQEFSVPKTKKYRALVFWMWLCQLGPCLLKLSQLISQISGYIFLWWPVKQKHDNVFGLLVAALKGHGIQFLSLEQRKNLVIHFSVRYEPFWSCLFGSIFRSKMVSLLIVWTWKGQGIPSCTRTFSSGLHFEWWTWCNLQVWYHNCVLSSILVNSNVVALCRLKTGLTLTQTHFTQSCTSLFIARYLTSPILYFVVLTLSKWIFTLNCNLSAISLWGSQKRKHKLIGPHWATLGWMCSSSSLISLLEGCGIQLGCTPCARDFGWTIRCCEVCRKQFTGPLYWRGNNS